MHRDPGEVTRNLAEGQDRVRVDGVELLGQVSLPTGTEFRSTEVGGLSGLAYDARRDVFVAVSDDRSAVDPARLYTLRLDLADGDLAPGDLELRTVRTLKDATGAPFVEGAIDAEGIALSGRGSLFISSEGDAAAGVDPFIGEFGLGGRLRRTFELPEKFLPDAEGTAGVRPNLAFESLTLTPDRRFLVAATENALAQDGEVATLEAGSPSRVVVFDARTGEALREFRYDTDAIPAGPAQPGGFADNGLVELLALDNTGSALALERSFAEGVGNSIRLYAAGAQGATDISGFASLVDPATGETSEVDAPVAKELLADLAELGLTPDNVEALSFGPRLADGRQTVVLASDNNFNDAQETQFIALALDAETVPAIRASDETPDALRYGDPAAPDFSREVDADDPAIWVHPDDPARSKVIATVKDGGLRVYDLDGEEVQSIAPEGVRYNNVDLVRDFDLDGRGVDLAVASDRANDTLAVFAIDPGDGVLREVTAPALADPAFSIFGEDDGEATAYGLATYTSPETGESFAFVTQADGNLVAQVRLSGEAGGVGAEVVRTLDLPIPEGGEPEDSQAEGIVADRGTGDLYVALEGAVGILKYGAEPDAGGEPTLVASIDEPFLKPDLEGLTIAYGEGEEEGYLIASSQGDATFAVFERGGDNGYLGSFAVGAGRRGDGVEESDGLDVVEAPLGGRYPEGLLVVQDGSNEPQVVGREPDDGEIQNFNTNFKFVPWQRVADLFEGEAQIAATDTLL